MNVEMTHTFTVSEEQLEDIKFLQKAMQKFSIERGSTKEEAEKYYTLQRVFDFVMQLGQNSMISERIENAAFHYDKYYEEGTYKYSYGAEKSRIRKEI